LFILVKELKTRIQHKHDIPANWDKATFVPLAGELIIYDNHYFDSNGNKVIVADVIKYKVGDGVTPIYDLPFVETVDLVSDQIIKGEKTFFDKIALSDKDGAKKYIAFDSTNLAVSEEVTVSGITGSLGETVKDGELSVTYYVASVEKTTNKPIKHIELDSTLHTVSYTPGGTSYTVVFKGIRPSEKVSATLTITYDAVKPASYILPTEAGTFATQEWVENSLAPVAKSGKFEDLIIDWLQTELVFDGGDAGSGTPIALVGTTPLQ
jgi:hypothetical protein